VFLALQRQQKHLETSLDTYKTALKNVEGLRKSDKDKSTVTNYHIIALK
jgi:prefoldin subunit 5